MKRIYFVVIAILLMNTAGFSQKGNNSIGVGGDLSFPMGEFSNFYKTGFGAYTKALLGVARAGQISFTAGYSSFKFMTNFEGVNSTISLAPVLVGYRHNFNGFFVEPQVGYSIANIKISADELEDDITDSGGFLTWAATVGYVFNKQVEISARYQVGGTNSTKMNLFGLRLGYNFSLGAKK